MTFSVVARDPETGRLGVAAASAVLAVGRTVPWARAGVGVVATQAFSNRGFGPVGLRGLGQGRSGPSVLAELLATDPQRADRQVAVLDASGAAAAWTGGGCIPACADAHGDGFSVQGNMLASRSVVPTMAAAYAQAGGDFTARLLATLRAADEAGGDIRGRQSAALLIVGLERDDDAQPVEVDLRVDDHADPIGELGRLAALQRALECGDWETLQHSANGGMRELYSALAAARRGEVEQARSALNLLRREPGWDALLRRLRAAGRLDHAGELLD